VHGKLRVVPFGGPPGIREQAEPIAAPAQLLQGLNGIGEDNSPAIDGTRIAIQGDQ